MIDEQEPDRGRTIEFRQEQFHDSHPLGRFFCRSRSSRRCSSSTSAELGGLVSNREATRADLFPAKTRCRTSPMTRRYVLSGRRRRIDEGLADRSFGPLQHPLGFQSSQQGDHGSVRHRSVIGHGFAELARGGLPQLPQTGHHLKLGVGQTFFDIATFDQRMIAVPLARDGKRGGFSEYRPASRIISTHVDIVKRLLNVRGWAAEPLPRGPLFRRRPIAKAALCVYLDSLFVAELRVRHARGDQSRSVAAICHRLRSACSTPQCP